jgi:hypothetical protein
MDTAQSEVLISQQHARALITRENMLLGTIEIAADPALKRGGVVDQPRER